MTATRPPGRQIPPAPLFQRGELRLTIRRGCDGFPQPPFVKGGARSARDLPLRAAPETTRAVSSSFKQITALSLGAESRNPLTSEAAQDFHWLRENIPCQAACPAGTD